MNKEQYFLTKVAEECNELAQAALKIQQFGKDSVNPYTNKTNLQTFEDEFNDLLAAVEMFNGSGYEEMVNRYKIFNKIQKVMKYMKISEDLGFVEK